MSIYAIEFLDCIYASSAILEQGKVQRIDISLPGKPDTFHGKYTGMDDKGGYPYPFVLHGLVQVVVHTEKFIITSMIHITTISNIDHMCTQQMAYDVQNKSSLELRCIFLSQSDTNDVLTFLLKKSAQIYSANYGYIEPPPAQVKPESPIETLVRVYRRLTGYKERDYSEYL